MVGNIKEELKNLTSNFLDSIPEIDFQEDGKIIKFSKNKCIFGKIENDKIFFIDKAGRFTEIEKELLEDKDNFLKAATRAYWIASGEKITATMSTMRL